MRLHSDESGVMMADAGPTLPRAIDGGVVRTLARVVAVRGRVALERGLPLRREADASLRLACDAARQSGFHAEQLVLMVKESWRSLAQPRERREFELALEELVSLCIAEFYCVREGSRKIPSVPNADRRGPALIAPPEHGGRPLGASARRSGNVVEPAEPKRVANDVDAAPET